MMSRYTTIAAVGLALLASAGNAMAGGSVKDEPAEEPRRCSYSINLGGTSEYIFRGIGQSVRAIDEPAAPALQGGADLTCGIFYAGVWGSSIDFGLPSNNADIEIDFYAGIKPTWGKATFDFGVIYYYYPGTDFAGRANIDYVELKAGVSGQVIDKLTLGVTGFYSPDYTFETGEVVTVEGTAAYELPAWGKITPSITALIGYQHGSDNAYFTNVAGTDDDYVYWNIGLALAIDKITLDFRYHDTDIGNDAANICADARLCDERFVFSAKFTLP